MGCRNRRVLMIQAILLVCIFLSIRVAADAQQSEPSAPSPAVQNLGPVGEQESKPSNAAPPANSVVDPGVIPEPPGDYARRSTKHI